VAIPLTLVRSRSLRASYLLSLVLLLAFFGDTVHASPWPRKKGHGYVQIGFSRIGYNQIYNNNGEKQPTAEVGDNVLQLYAQHGMSERFTMTVMVPYKVITAGSFDRLPNGSAGITVPGDQTNSGIGDISLTARYNAIRTETYVLSGEVLFGLPTGDTTNMYGLILGDGDFNVGVGLGFGASFSALPLYFSVEAGYNFRGLGYSDEVRADLEVGYGLFDRRLNLIVLVSQQWSTFTEPTRFTSAYVLGLANGNREFLAITPKLLYKLDGGFGVVLSYGTAVSGRNVASGAVLAAGLFYEY
jgi:hypothetical protein